MKKIFLFLVILALSFGAKAQSWTPIFGKQRFASGLGIPTKDSTYFAGAADSSLIYMNPKDASLYYKYKGYHKKVVPYTGANSNVNFGEYGLSAGFLGLDTTPTGTPTGLGTLSWDPFYRTASLIDGTGVTNLQVGQEERVLVHNNTGLTLSDGQVVYVTGSTGELPSVALASNGSEATSSVTFGVVTETILNGADGFITTSGLIHGLNTLAYTEGAAIWLGSTAGTFTQTKPVAPQNTVLIGYVIKRAGGNGSIFVKIQNGYELDELHDVLITSKANNDGLFYESSTNLWKNKSIATVLGYTPEQPLTFSAPLSRSVNTVSIPAATGSVNGYLSSTDWTTFNSKQAQINGTGFVKASGTTISYDNSTYLTTSAAASTYVPYTGAIGNVNLGNNDISAASFTGGTGNFSTTGAGNAVLITHSSGAGNALSISKGGAGIGLDVTISGTGDGVKINHLASRAFTLNSSGGGYGILINNEAASTSVPFTIQKQGLTAISMTDAGAGSFASSLTASSFIKSGGTSSQFLKADGSVDANTYLTTGSATSTYVPYTGATGAVNLGNYDLTVNSVKVGRGAGAVATNTVLGTGALNSNTTGSNNTAIGYLALINNTTGGNNTAIGKESIYTNTTGGNNVGVGYQALNKNTTGGDNTAVGNFALSNNTTASNNIAVGGYALFNNTTGTYNTSLGFQVNINNTTGSNITAVGFQANLSNTTGNDNTAIGYQALAGNTTGYYNTVLGKYAGQYITTGNSNTIIGAYPGTAAMTSNVILSDGAGNIRFQYNGTNTILGQSGSVILNGALSGTSATFSGDVTLTTAGSTTITNNGTNPIFDFIRTNNASTPTAQINFKTSQGTVRWQIGTNQAVGAGFEVNEGNGTANRFYIAPGGAATFSSSVGIGTSGGSVSLEVLNTSSAASNNPGNSQIRASASSTKWLSIGYDPTINAGYLQGAESGISWRPIILNLNGANSSPILIGTSTNDGVSKLQVTGNSSFNGDATVYYNNIKTFSNSYGNTGLIRMYGIDGLEKYQQGLTTGGDFYQYTFSGLNHIFYTSGAERMRIRADGLLDYKGAATTTNAQFVLENTNSGVYFYSSNTSGVAKSFTFYTSGLERLQIANNGQLQIKQSGNTYSDGLRITNTSGNYWSITHGGDNSLYLGYNVADRGVFNTSTGIYTPLSDRNKKKDFEDSNIGLNEILQLKPTLYRMKTDLETSEKQLGFIAQDVKGIIPSAYVESGSFIGLNFNPIVATLVKAVQEQQGQIKELNQKIINLEAQIKQ